LVLLEPATQIHLATPEVCQPQICHELNARLNQVNDIDPDVLIKAILGEHASVRTDPNSGLFEPNSPEEESFITNTMVQYYWDVPFPGFGEIRGEDIGVEIQSFVDSIISNMHKFPLEYKVIIIAISHSGILEHFIKLVYLQNKPRAKPQNVNAQTIGGLVNFLDGPRILIQKTQFAPPTIRFVYKHLLLPYKPAGPGRMTLE